MGRHRELRKFESAARFTLIELLVVIVIILILASLLLPALQDARDRAQRVVCLGEKKQLGVSVLMYCDDQDDFFPHPVDLSTGTMYNYQQWFQGHNSQLYDGGAGTGTLSGLAGLAKNGYVQDRSLLYDPGFDNTGNAWVSPLTDAEWQQFMDAPLSGPMPGALGYRRILAVSEYFYTFRQTAPLEVPQYTTYDVSKLQFFVNHHDDPALDAEWGVPGYQGAISPILVSCYNRNEPYYGVSHQGAGVNAVYFDGHGRWISRDEVIGDAGYPPPYYANYITAYGNVNVLGSYYPLGGWFCFWARKYAMLE